MLLWIKPIYLIIHPPISESWSCFYLTPPRSKSPPPEPLAPLGQTLTSNAWASFSPQGSGPVSPAQPSSPGMARSCLLSPQCCGQAPPGHCQLGGSSGAGRAVTSASAPAASHTHTHTHAQCFAMPPRRLPPKFSLDHAKMPQVTPPTRSSLPSQLSLLPLNFPTLEALVPKEQQGGCSAGITAAQAVGQGNSLRWPAGSKSPWPRRKRRARQLLCPPENEGWENGCRTSYPRDEEEGEVERRK